MKKYFLIDNNSFTIETYSNKLKEIQEDFIKQLKDDKKKRGYYNIQDYSIECFEYNSKNIDIDYYLDRELYIFDKKTDDFIDYKNFWKYGIKNRTLKKDFLYYNM